MVHLATADCIGVEILDNTLYGGSGQIATGKASPAVLKGNRALPSADAPRPMPPVPSIYEWQKNRASKEHSK
jgi:hypothetical protein